MFGICGTCGMPAEATGSNEGYSDCCNDRIEYGDEARETVALAQTDAERSVEFLTKRIASLSSQRSRARNIGDAGTEAELTYKIEMARQHKAFSKQDAKAFARILTTHQF